MITLDPDFRCYDILEVKNKDHFTFAYYEDIDLSVQKASVHCFEYSELRGEFVAKRIGLYKWEAIRGSYL